MRLADQTTMGYDGDISSVRHAISSVRHAMSQAVIGRWGKNLAIRFPGDVARDAGLDLGQRVEIVAAQDAVVIRRLPEALTIESMFEGVSPENWRDLYEDAYDWGPDLGLENIEA